MKRFYQTEWQGIPFASFAELSASQLAGAEFYNAFYREVFRRYGGYDELDVAWRRDKGEQANWIARRLPAGARVLSVGAGLGYMEHCLHRDHAQDFELCVQDYASDALTWLQRELPTERIHLIGQEGGLQAGDGPYDLIYLFAVDYAIEDDALVDLLAELKTLLRDSGACLLISASFLEEALTLADRIEDWGKGVAKHLLEAAGLYRRGQFWGWKRTRSEYQNLMYRSGYLDVTDGFIQTPNQRSFYIEGRVAVT